jgi:HEPN domain-containing protein
MEKILKKWYLFAKADLDAAKRLLESKTYLLDLSFSFVALSSSY